MIEKLKIKKGETFETLEIAELPDEALEAIAGGAGQTDDFVCKCAACGAVLVGEDALEAHANQTDHSLYHWA